MVVDSEDQRSWRPEARAAGGAPGLRVSTFELGGESFLVASHPIAESAVAETLTAAEREVARLVLEGLSNARIAHERGTSRHTVANQIAALLRKTGARSRAELARRLSAPDAPGAQDEPG